MIVEAGRDYSNNRVVTDRVDNPYIVTPLTNQSVGTGICSFAPAIFTAAAVGLPTPTVQWKVTYWQGYGVSFPSATTTSTSNGITSTTLAISGSQFPLPAVIQVTFTNAGGSVFTSATLNRNSCIN